MATFSLDEIESENFRKILHNQYKYCDELSLEFIDSTIYIFICNDIEIQLRAHEIYGNNVKIWFNILDIYMRLWMYQKSKPTKIEFIMNEDSYTISSYYKTGSSTYSFENSNNPKVRKKWRKKQGKIINNIDDICLFCGEKRNDKNMVNKIFSIL